MMTQEDWLDYFESVHHRKPTSEEYFQAKQNGEFVKHEEIESHLETKEMPKTKSKKNILLLIMGVIILTIGGTAFWLYQTRNISGVYQMVEHKYYNSESEEFDDYETLVITTTGEVFSRYLKVEGQDIQYAQILQTTYEGGVKEWLDVDFNDLAVLEKVNYIDQKIELAVSDEDYQLIHAEYLEDTALDGTGYSKKVYEKDGDSLVIETYNLTNKLVDVKTYQKMSKQEVDKLEQKIDSLERKNY